MILFQFDVQDVIDGDEDRVRVCCVAFDERVTVFGRVGLVFLEDGRADEF